jgi:hypothetical protein
MLRWLAANNLPDPIVPVVRVGVGLNDLSEAEKEGLAAMRRASVEKLLRLREAGKEERAKMWPVGRSFK